LKVIGWWLNTKLQYPCMETYNGNHLTLTQSENAMLTSTLNHHACLEWDTNSLNARDGAKEGQVCHIYIPRRAHSLIQTYWHICSFNFLAMTFFNKGVGSCQGIHDLFYE
jgi:hypothetical protein